MYSPLSTKIQKNAAPIAQEQIGSPIFLTAHRQHTSQHNTDMVTKRITPNSSPKKTKNA
jgi:hypothetical protein